MGSAVGVTFEGDRGYGDAGEVSELLFQGVVARLAVGRAEPPAVVVDHDGGMIGIVEGRRAPLERRVVEVPSR